MTPLSSWDSQKALAFSATTPRTAAAGELFGSGDLSRERGSRCSRASRVGENVGVGHGRILQEAAEFLHITLFLAGEPDDDVAAESHDGPESVDFSTARRRVSTE